MPDTTNTVAQGWVYLIVNDLIPDRVKIGYTKRDPIDRAYELISTGTTGTFVVIYQALVHEPYRVEQEVHRRFADSNRGLEWFEVCPNRAKEEILLVAGAVLYEDTTPRWHSSQPVPNQRARELLKEARKAADEARQAEAAARARRAEEEEAARRAVEAARLERERVAEQERRRCESEEEKRRAEEQERLAAEAERRQRAAEEREKKTRLLMARAGKALLVGSVLLACFPIVNYVKQQEGESRARSAAACRAEVVRLRGVLNSTRATLNDQRAAISRLTKELNAASSSQKTLPVEEKQWQEKLRSAHAQIEDHDKYFLSLPGSERNQAERTLARSLEWQRQKRKEAAEALEEVRDKIARVNARVKAIPQELAQVRRLEAQAAAKESAIERELAEAERKAANFGSAISGGNSR